ncbi:MAG: DUF4363 family protein [Clostridiales bacterium]|nr:DUF4363 family protein [Clostridiales bacterium]
MKSFISAMAIAALLIAGGIAFNIGIGKWSENLMEDCDKINDAISEQDFEAAIKEITVLSEKIDNRKTVLASVINHESIDDIEVCVSELMGYADSMEGIEATVRCIRLKHMLEHLPENYSVTAQNIL